MKRNWIKISYILAALILAILLSIYANGKSDTYSTRATTASGKTDTNLFSGLTTKKKVTISVPLQITGIDTEKYFISGAPSTVKIKLAGSAALVTAAQNTKNFTVYVDLNKLTDGEHKVSLKVNGLNKELTYQLNKKSIKVAIYKRARAYYTVKPRYNDDAIADGYKVGNVTSSVTNVEIMGRTSLVDSVSRVVADVTLSRDTKETVSKQVTLQALNAINRPVDVTISPEITTVHIPISAGTGTKTLPIKFNTKNGNRDDFDITANVNEAVVSGKMDVLEKLDSITADVDLSGINSENQQKITLDIPDKVDSVDPTEIMVTITPKEQEN